MFRSIITLGKKLYKPIFIGYSKRLYICVKLFITAPKTLLYKEILHDRYPLSHCFWCR